MNIEENSEKSFKNYTIGNFIFKDSLVILFKDQLVLFNYSDTKSIRYKELSRAILNKKRQLRWNYLMVFVTAFFLFILYYFKSEFDSEIKILAVVMVLILLIAIVFFKEFNYEIVLLKNNDTLKIKVAKRNVPNAKLLCNKINTIIKEDRQNN